MKRRKKIILFFITLTAGILILLWYCNSTVAAAAENKLYTDVTAIPFNKTGLLLGTSKFVASGKNNRYYEYRIQAAINLIRADKIKYLIISGDNGRKDYNEPDMMRADLIASGIDSSIIFLDYAGFRTFDSVKRLKEIFGQEAVTIISQQFHNERAIYIAKREGITAIGYNAPDVNSRQGFKTQLREKFARLKVFADYWFGVKPKFSGDKIILPS